MKHCLTDRLPRESDPHLRLAFEYDDGRQHSLPHCKPLLIGSAEDCELRVGDRFTSCRHARVIYTPRGYCIEDLGSTNGTLVDGVPVDSAILEPGMKVEIGRVRMSVTRIDKSVDEVRPQRARSKPEADPPKHRLLGRSQVMKTLRRQLEKLALLPLPVLLHGETGTGKELAARTLHEFGTLPETPFVALNCGAIPAGLFESELFGHRRGAFTGAHRDHAGAFVRAGFGTLFLDEVAELPIDAQAKLLRVLETRRLTPVGGDAEVDMNCRIVAATHRDLRAMVESGDFREDLYHRLGVVALELPPLRRRRTDIPLLLAHFVDRASAELGREVVLSQAAAAEALAHAWPGNVRALRNAVLRAAALCEGPITAMELLPSTDEPRPRGDLISVPRGTYASMHAALLQQVVAEEGSVRRAARILDVPRSTLGAWMRRLQSGTAPATT
ncbi:Nitrogen assimilation regulatory protein [Enhygromyxa salina]|uniref:Nitrogen assimilation regulatory protein n=1 Tax=Enhygromyxa salina TaxID=215803 RepID=A0A2S9XB65_9BACT|nr:sigma 54-interacting transcriptional regulator [Enhygromyxa salina]PRP90040.1 Nitrogen assimilation regulatory protein [Enhygromyxa salina]